MGVSKKNWSRTVSKVLPEIASHNGWEEKLDMYSFFPVWDQVVDDYIAECTKPLKIVRGVLWLEVENSTWMQQLQFEKMRILNDINATLKLSRIKDIKFLLPQDNFEEKKEDVQIAFVAPDPEALKKFEKQAAMIEDDTIRDALVRLWYLSKACKRKKKKE